MNGESTKNQLVQKLFETLKMTRAGAGIENMKLEDGYVIISFEGGGIRRAPVEGDSGIALIRDVVNQI